MNPLVSVILPCYGMGKFLSAALASVAGQTYQNFEVIIVDDCGPEDGTREAALQFIETLPDKRIIFHRMETNGGAGAARNHAMTLSRGEVFAFLDPDDMWLPMHLSTSLENLKDADVSITSAICVAENSELIGTYQEGRLDVLIEEFPLSLARENFLLPSCTVIRRNGCERVGDFLGNKRNAADWDYYFRCLAAGLSFLISKAETVHYRKHAGAATSNFLKMAKSCVFVFEKNLPHMNPDMQREMSKTLHYFLGRLIYMKTSFRDWSFPSEIISSLKLQPANLTPWKSMVSGFRNNWHKLNLC